VGSGVLVVVKGNTTMTSAHSDFRALVAPHLETLYRSAYRLTGNRWNAEDVVQEVCARAYANLGTIQSLEHPKTWLLKVAYRVFVDGVRRRARAPVRATAEDFDATRASDDPSPEDAVELDLTARRLLAALGELEREQRALLALHVEGYSLAELHDITKLSTDVLKARLYRARVRLGKLLAAEGTTPALVMEK
jgi:RNA polymerase sigma-70 factor (ECF subfamily)